jgi:hypothetical protein
MHGSEYSNIARIAAITGRRDLRHAARIFATSAHGGGHSTQELTMQPNINLTTQLAALAPDTRARLSAAFKSTINAEIEQQVLTSHAPGDQTKFLERQAATMDESAFAAFVQNLNGLRSIEHTLHQLQEA